MIETDVLQWIKVNLRYEESTGKFWWRTKKQGRRMSRPAGSRTFEGYIAIRIKGNHFLAHRLVWLLYYGSWPIQQIDHINQCKDDNRIENLRDVSPTVNSHNVQQAPAHKTTDLPRGVRQVENRYIARIQIKGVSRERSFYTVEACIKWLIRQKEEVQSA